MKNGNYPKNDTLERYRDAVSERTDEGEAHVTIKPVMPDAENKEEEVNEETDD